MAARAFERRLEAGKPAQRSNIVFHPKLAPAARTPLAPMPRRSILNAAAHEGLKSDVRLAGKILVVACCIGLGLALGIHFDEILHDLRLMTFDVEEPRWLWRVVDSL